MLENEKNRSNIVCTSSIKRIKRIGVPITPATMYTEMESLMQEYTGRQILQEVKKL